MAKPSTRRRRRPASTIGPRITELRKVSGIERDDLAKLLKIQPQKMWRLETGRTRVTAEDLRRIAALLNQPIEAFYAPPTAEAQASAA